MVSGLDIAIGQIVEKLKQEGLYEESIILFSSDNGGHNAACGVRRGCGDDGGSGGSNYPLRGQRATLWEGGMRVPAFLHSPLLQNTSSVYNG